VLVQVQIGVLPLLNCSREEMDPDYSTTGRSKSDCSSSSMRKLNRALCMRAAHIPARIHRFKHAFNFADTYSCVPLS
jgi:hypothetical protein